MVNAAHARQYTVDRQHSGPKVKLPLGLNAAPTNGQIGSAELEMLLTAVIGMQSDIRHLVAAVGGTASEEDAEAAESAAVAQAAEEKEKLADELQLVKNEVHALSYSIQETKEEVAALYRSAETDTRMTVVQHELDGVVAATANATSQIIESMEQIDEAAASIQKSTENDYLRSLAETIADQVTSVFEACNFQDLTGQRLGKVVNTLKYVEERVEKIIKIWGEDDINAVDLPDAPKGLDDLDKIIDKKSVNVERVSQDDIDKMFD